MIVRENKVNLKKLIMIMNVKLRQKYEGEVHRGRGGGRRTAGWG